VLDVVGIGSPLVDVLARTDDTVIGRLGFEKGTMALVDLARAEEIRAGLGSVTEVSGGSVANAMVGIAALGGRAAFIGKVADDALGKTFGADLRAAGVELDATIRPADATGDSGTGRCLVLVTPDGQRTMATHLGVAGTLAAGDLPEHVLRRGRILLLEGYLWDVPSAKAAMRRAAEVVHRSDGVVALSLSDPLCVDRHRREFLDLLQSDVDVVFANEEEATMLFGAPDLAGAAAAMQETGLLAALTRGPQGSVVVSPNGVEEVPATAVDEVVDTTAAGDLFAAGFLYGLSHDAGPVDCARLGALCAAEIIDHLGARPRADLRALAAAHGVLPGLP